MKVLIKEDTYNQVLSMPDKMHLVSMDFNNFRMTNYLGLSPDEKEHLFVRVGKESEIVYIGVNIDKGKTFIYITGRYDPITGLYEVELKEKNKKSQKYIKDSEVIHSDLDKEDFWNIFNQLFNDETE